MDIIVYQGDQYCIPFRVTMAGEAVTPDTAAEVEFSIGELRKMYPTEASYDAETGEFLVPVTQQETFGMEGKQEVQVRVRLHSGDVFGSDSGRINVRESLSKVVMG